MTPPPLAVSEVLRSLIRHPARHFVRGWNWKSAVMSAVCRGTIFFAANLPAGIDAGVHAFATELAFRGIVSGALGSATQAFRNATPPAAAMFAALLVIPTAGHAAEYAVHRFAGTARPGESIAASVIFSMVTTGFTLFAMRRGALIVGAGQHPLARDLLRMPGLAAEFVRAIVDAGARLTRRRPEDRCPCRRSI